MKINVQMEFDSVHEMRGAFERLAEGTAAHRLMEQVVTAPAVIGTAEEIPAAPAKARGRPKKDAAPAPELAPPSAPAEVSCTPATSAPVIPSSAATTAPTESQAVSKDPEKESIIMALSTYRNKNGRDAVLALIQKHGGKDSLSSIDKKNWLAVYTEAKAGV